MDGLEKTRRAGGEYDFTLCYGNSEEGSDLALEFHDPETRLTFASHLDNDGSASAD